MVLYARSDLACVFVPAESFGGCGVQHSRPVHDGAPAKVWPLNCPPCEDHLRHNPHWAATPSDIPETYDETKAREALEKRSAQNSSDLTALMLAVLAGDKQAEALQRELIARRGGALLDAPAATVLCPSGHANAPGQKFCGECGSPMHDVAAERQAAPPVASQEPSAPPQPEPRAVGDGDAGEDLAALLALHPQKLRKMCRDAGLDDKGKVPELAARLREAGVRAG